jgi:hypothetical protein
MAAVVGGAVEAVSDCVMVEVEASVDGELSAGDASTSTLLEAEAEAEPERRACCSSSA